MKIASVSISVFQLPGLTRHFELIAEQNGQRWRQKFLPRQLDNIHVLHVETEDGIEGVCTVGDARYSAMRPEDLFQLRHLVVGEDSLAREYLYRKLSTATRNMFAVPGWFGAFDNCLWDIAGKVADLPIATLLGRARDSAPCYYNFFGRTREAALADAQSACGQGFVAFKDHVHDSVAENLKTFEYIRAGLPPEATLIHDAATAGYDFESALRIGRALQALDYAWFEEPIPDRQLTQLRRLCRALEIPIVAPETLTNDVALCAEWLIAGATDKLRGNARVGVTPTLKLAALAELHATTIEMNGPGGLFGLVHAHLCCALAATTFYEVFPGGTRDLVGKEIGMQNPPIAKNGNITPPSGPGWGAEWDWKYFRAKRVAVL